MSCRSIINGRSRSRAFPVFCWSRHRLTRWRSWTPFQYRHAHDRLYFGTFSSGILSFDPDLPFLSPRFFLWLSGRFSSCRKCWRSVRGRWRRLRCFWLVLGGPQPTGIYVCPSSLADEGWPPNHSHQSWNYPLGHLWSLISHYWNLFGLGRPWRWARAYRCSSWHHIV